VSEILLLGDLILDVPEPDHWLAGIAPLTRAADVVIGHLEVPYTSVTDEVPGSVAFTSLFVTSGRPREVNGLALLKFTTEVP